MHKKFKIQSLHEIYSWKLFKQLPTAVTVYLKNTNLVRETNSALKDTAIEYL